MGSGDAEAPCAWAGVAAGSDEASAAGAAGTDLPQRPDGAHARDLFAPATTRRRRSVAWLCVQGSVAAHGLLAAALVLVPILVSAPAPAPLHAEFRAVLLDAPPPPPPPLATRSSVPVVPKPVATVPPNPRPEALQVPDDLLDKPPDPSAVSEGVEGGVPGGVVGGIPGGVVGGVIGGTGTGIVPVPEPDRQPVPLKLTKPRYPPEAFAKRVEGKVVLEILIDASGRVIEARVVQSVPLLDAAALETVREWRFTPAIKDGRAVAALARAPVTFRIH